MGYAERLTKRVEPYLVELQPNWQQTFRPEHKTDPTIDQELLMSLEGWLTSYVVFIKMQQETLAPAKAVRKALNKIANIVFRHHAPSSSNADLSKLLTYRNEDGDVAARAHNVALDWIACGLPSTYSIFRSTAPRPADAEAHLQAALRSESGVANLKNSILGQQTAFNLDPNQKIQRLRQLDGHQLPNGSIFTYRPDPRQLSHARPEQAARDILAAALRDIYRCTGSPPHVPRDGSPTSPFLRFLEAARKSLPRGYQTSLVSPARRAEIDERKHGPGTLERFKAKLYHPDCWRI